MARYFGSAVTADTGRLGLGTKKVKDRWFKCITWMTKTVFAIFFFILIE